MITRRSCVWCGAEVQVDEHGRWHLHGKMKGPESDPFVRCPGSGAFATSTAAAAAMREQEIRASALQDALDCFKPWRKHEDIRLRAGEMTPQEIRSVVAVTKAIAGAIHQLLQDAKVGDALDTETQENGTVVSDAGVAKTGNEARVDASRSQLDAASASLPNTLAAPASLEHAITQLVEALVFRRVDNSWQQKLAAILEQLRSATEISRTPTPAFALLLDDKIPYSIRNEGARRLVELQQKLAEAEHDRDVAVMELGECRLHLKLHIGALQRYRDG